MSTIKTDALTSVTTNTDLTLSANGTGGVKVSDYFQLTKGSDISSATGLSLGTDGNAFDVTGTTTITTIGTQGIGSHITLHFDGALTFTHHATNLILPGAANITTAAGDIAVMYEYASADWRCVTYTKANGKPVTLQQTKGSDISSATSLTLGTDGNLFDVTGATTITSIATQGIGSYVTLHFDGALTFTHDSADLILPGAANITTAAGDIAVMYEYASGDWRCVSYTKASGAAVVAASSGFTLGTEQATTSGTSITFSSIPSGTKMIVIMFEGVSFTAQTNMDVTIGDSGGLETAGYLSICGNYVGSDASTAEFVMKNDSGALDAVSGNMILVLKDSSNFTWTSSHGVRYGHVDAFESSGGGHKSLSAELTQLAISGGTFDAGSINIMYQ